MVGSAGSRVDKSAGDTGDKETVIDLKLDSVLEVTFPLLEHGIEAFGLGDGAGEAIENKAVASKVSVTPIGQELNQVLTRPGTPCCCRAPP